MNKEELEQIKLHMEEEHRRDLEALERVMRFLPSNGALPVVPPPNVDPNAATLAGDDKTILGGIEEIFQNRANRTWTAPQIKAELEAHGYRLTAKNPIATIGVAVKKLLDRNKITLIRPGSGRQPHIYQAAKTPPIEDCVVLEEPQTP